MGLEEGAMFLGVCQDQVDAAGTFPEVYQEYKEWMKSVVGARSMVFITCGDWDLLTMLPRQLHLSGLTASRAFKRWINIKKVYTRFYNRKAMGMAGMLRDLGMELQGRHHSGIDDCRNIARLKRRIRSLRR